MRAKFVRRRKRQLASKERKTSSKKKNEGQREGVKRGEGNVKQAKGARNARLRSVRKDSRGDVLGRSRGAGQSDLQGLYKNRKTAGPGKRLNTNRQRPHRVVRECGSPAESGPG